MCECMKNAHTHSRISINIGIYIHKSTHNYTYMKIFTRCIQ